MPKKKHFNKKDNQDKKGRYHKSQKAKKRIKLYNNFWGESDSDEEKRTAKKQDSTWKIGLLGLIIPFGFLSFRLLFWFF